MPQAQVRCMLKPEYRVRLPAVADSIDAGGSIPPPSTEGLSSGRLVYVKVWGASQQEKRTTRHSPRTIAQKMVDSAH
jgi:hypothetical protein